jgi:hypothetical protein
MGGWRDRGREKCNGNGCVRQLLLYSSWAGVSQDVEAWSPNGGAAGPVAAVNLLLLWIIMDSWRCAAARAIGLPGEASFAFAV